MQTIKTLVREFSVAFLVAISWTWFSQSTNGSHWDSKSAIGAFASAFFLVSWATGQFFRVRKQVSLDRNLVGLETRLQSLLTLIEERTKELIAYATGSEGMAFFEWMPSGNDLLLLNLANSSKYPVFDVHAEWIDLDEAIEPAAGKMWTRHRFLCPALWPNKLVMPGIQVPLVGRDRFRMNIFIQTRGTSSIQEVRVVKSEQTLLVAMRKKGPGGFVDTRVPPNFPGFNPADPDAVFR